jgi:hypothetical protein
MATTRSFLAAAVLGVTLALAGCGHEARVAVRNVQVTGEVLATQGPDDLTRAMGRSIAEQAKASADQMDLLLWGLLARQTKPTITAQDWVDSPASAERRSHDQAVKVERETERIQAISGTIFESLGLASGLTGTGILGLLAAWALKNQATLRAGLERAVEFAQKVKNAKTDADVAAIEDEHRALPENKPLKKALAKVKKTSKVS